MIKKEVQYCFLDLETTGFDKKKDSILEVAFILVQGNNIIEKFTQVFVPDKNPLSDFVSHLTGISYLEIENSGQNLSDKKWQKRISALIGDSVILGHNIDFDIEFLKQNGFLLEKNERIDTHELSRILLPGEPSFALEILAKKYGFLHEKAHRALDDVLASYELFKLLKEKIETLPQDFLKVLNLFFKTDKTHWYAKNLFFLEKEVSSISENLDENKSIDFEKIELKDLEGNIFENLNLEETFKILKKQNNLAIKLNTNRLNRLFYRYIFNKSKDEKFLLITNSIKNFPEIKPFPTPEVIIDPERLENFQAKKETLNDQETTFYLKCLYRVFLGFRGVDKFDLFFQERNLWQLVCIKDKNENIYQKILKEKTLEKTLTITPNAFFQFRDLRKIKDKNLNIFKDRILIIDEGEKFIENLFHFPKESFEIKKYLDSDDLSIANQTHFFVKRFCQEYIEKKTDKKITPFPEKVLIEPGDGFEVFLEEVLKLKEFETLIEKKKLIDQFIRNIKEKTPEILSFVTYYPESGNISFSFWEKDIWQKIKEDLGNFKKIIGYRVNNQSIIKSFFRYFLGVTDFNFHPLNFNKKERRNMETPRDLISQNSPDFNIFCAERIAQIFKKKTGNTAVNFSSLETLRKVYDSVLPYIEKDSVLFLGERVSGGMGKILEILETNKKIENPKKVLFFYQRTDKKALENFNFKTLVFQKFPFPAPDPLIQNLEKELKLIHLNFWDLWLSPQIISDIARRASVLPEIESIIFLDPRYNTPWGQKFIQSAFPDCF